VGRSASPFAGHINADRNASSERNVFALKELNMRDLTVDEMEFVTGGVEICVTFENCYETPFGTICFSHTVCSGG
jgi:hypothetical protein